MTEEEKIEVLEKQLEEMRALILDAVVLLSDGSDIFIDKQFVKNIWVEKARKVLYPG